MMMRIALVPLAALVAVPAVGQQATRATPTVEGYLCTFAGKCGGSSAEPVTRDAPHTRGFRIARPGGDEADATPAPAATPSRHSAGRSRAVAVRPAQASRGTRVQRNYAAAAAAPAASVGAGRRADLMIGFELNSDRLTPQGEASARVFAQSLMMPELRTNRFRIEGHTDERGGRGVNVPLSVRRAQRVANFLIEQGVAPARLETRGYGSSDPLPGRSTKSPANRRVEAELIS